MDYKKKYEELYERISNLVRDYDCVSGLIDVREELKSILNESQESEDERIRKDLIGYFESCGNMTFAHHRVSDIISCLEKQGKHNMGISVATKKKLEDNLHKALKKETSESCNKFLDEQGEQKPADKVEPKFKVGDWVTDSRITFHILKIEDERYIADDGDKVWADLTDKHYHLWTIQDAKDGDVLVDGDLPFIFKKIDANKHSYAYCGISLDYGFRVESEGEFGEWTWAQDITPATKEQCDLLFQKMKEAGYEWDAEKKELKKIEQKPVVIIPKFHEGDVIKPKDGGHEPWKIMQVDISDKKYRFKDGYVIHFSQEDDYELVEQKPTWSEEDEKMFRSSRCYLNEFGNWLSFENEEKSLSVYKACDWLESLKDRVQSQPKPHWKPSDEQMETIQEILTVDCPPNFRKRVESLYTDLKKL